jgi:hypothetical protein
MAIAERGDESRCEEKEKEILAWTEVSLLIESYNDIFSSFDPRPFSQRSLSVDFLEEAKRATREIKPGVFELRFLVPKAKRSIEKEIVIKKRLKEHFKKHHEMLNKEKRGIIHQGLFFVFFGFLFMVAAAYIIFFLGRNSFVKELMIVMLEPGGWFLFWEGLDLIIFKSKAVAPDLEFYRKMTKAEIIFSHY